jgi:glucose/arabinose dehydrogenase
MSIQRLASLAWAVLIASVCAVAPAAQQRVPFRNNIPVAPQGIRPVPLPEKPLEFHTAEGQDIRVVVVARGLVHPWSLAFLPDGGLLVTERPGRLRIVRDGALDPRPLAGVPTVRASGLSGLMDVALHPRFAENHYVYLTYTKPDLERILFNEKMEELRRESLLAEMRQRIRDVRQGPDELLYLLTDADDGAVLRVEPEREN